MHHTTLFNGQEVVRRVWLRSRFDGSEAIIVTRLKNLGNPAKWAFVYGAQDEDLEYLKKAGCEFV